MLYLIHMANHPALDYHGGQEPIVHLEANLHATVDWADKHGRRWAFTTSNAAAQYAKDYADLEKLSKIDWQAIRARSWRDHKEGKQAEFLVETSFPWELIERIGVYNAATRQKAYQAIAAHVHKPKLEIKSSWYY